MGSTAIGGGIPRYLTAILVGMLALRSGTEEVYFPAVADGDPPPTATAGVRVLRVQPDGAADRAGLVTGDRILAVDGRRLCGRREFDYLCAERPVERFHVELLVAGDTERRAVRVDDVLHRSMIGLELSDPRPGLPRLLVEHGRTVTRAERILLEGLPLRFRLRLAAALAAAPAGTAPDWLSSFLDTYFAVRREHYAEVAAAPAPAIPEPALAALDAFHRRWARLAREDPDAVGPEACGVSPAYFAFCLPYPDVQKPALGAALAYDTPRCRRLAAARTDRRAPDDVTREYCRQLLQTRNRTDQLLALLEAAVLDPKTFVPQVPGAPVLREDRARATFLRSVDQRLAAAADPVDRLFLRYARFVGAVADGDGNGAAEIFAELRRASPFLAWHAYRLAPRVARRHRRRPAPELAVLKERFPPDAVHRPPRLLPRFESWSRVEPALRPVLRGDNWSAVDGIPVTLSEHPEWIVAAVDPPPRGEILARANAEALARVWQQYGWVRSTDPHFLDVEESALAAERLRTLLGRDLPASAYAVMVACHSCAGDFARAERWLYRRRLRLGEGATATKRFDRWAEAIAKRRHFVTDESLTLQPVRKDNIRSEWHRDGDVRTGSYRRWYDSGKPREEGAYYQNKACGYWRFFRPDGGVSREGRFWRGRQFGTWTTYHDNGRPRSRGTYGGRMPEERVGRWKTWLPDGTLVTEGFYHHGRRDGLWRSYHPNGRLASEVAFRNGRQVGFGKRWDKRGVPLDPTLPEDWGAGEF